MIKDYLEIGQIVGTHGVRGELRVQPWCDSPEFFKKFKTLYYDAHGEKARASSAHVLTGISRSCALTAAILSKSRLAQRQGALYAPQRRAPQKGDWFIAELIGCRAEDANSGRAYGTVTDVSQTGANDVWHITDGDGVETLIPAIPDVVSSVDIENGVVLLTPLKGLFSDED